MWVLAVLTGSQHTFHATSARYHVLSWETDLHGICGVADATQLAAAGDLGQVAVAAASQGHGTHATSAGGWADGVCRARLRIHRVTNSAIDLRHTTMGVDTRLEGSAAPVSG